MIIKKFIFIFLILQIFANCAFADFYTKSITVSKEGSQYSENFIETNPKEDDDKEKENKIQYVQPVIYQPIYQPVYYPAVIKYPFYPHGYYNTNTGMSLNYHSGSTNFSVNNNANNKFWGSGYSLNHKVTRPLNNIPPPPPPNNNTNIKK